MLFADISLVPIDDLPLQSVIQFTPCPADVATSYLQALCSAEGYTINRDVISQLYEGQLISAPKLQRISPSRAPDLRRTINELEIRCSTHSGSHVQLTGGSRVEPVPDVSRTEAGLSMKKYEFFSYLDSNIDTDPSATFTVRAHARMDR